MAKILINYLSDFNIEHWGNFDKIKMDDVQNKIKDNNENDIKKIVTSVPSPFAQMHLYDSVFGMVAKNPDGNSIYHRLVSKCFDILEIAFNYNTLKDQGLTITKWNKDQQIERLKNSGSEGQKLLAETLELYTSKGKVMAEEDNIFMFLLDFEVIGGTSPFTLLFPSTNAKRLEIANTTGHHYFDEVAQPLHKREHNFQIFVHKIFMAHKILTSKCANFYAYLNEQPKFINDKTFRRELEDLRRNNTYHADNLNNDDYEILKFDNKEAVVILNNIPIPTRKKGSVDIKQKSDFVIRHNQNTNPPDTDNPPLVLLQGFSRGGMKYTQGDWKSTYEVPLLDEYTPLSDRILPVVAEKYPYLTINDFLESHLLALPYNVQRSRFYIGQVEYETGVLNSLPKFEKFNYLCPLKKRFFDYFTPEDVEKMLVFTIKDKDSVKVTLTIPIKKGEIVFEKYYYTKPSKEDYGKIIKIIMNIGIFPFYKMIGENEEKYNDYYKIMLLEKDKNIQGDFKLDFYCQQKDDDNQTNQKNIPKTTSFARKEKQPEPYGKEKSVFEDKRDTNKNNAGQNTIFFQVNNTSWDYLEITYPMDRNKNIRNILIPKWDLRKNGTEKYQFGVDFGTTNTYIAHTKENNKNAESFTISEKDIQMIMLNEPDKTKQDIKEKYYAKDIWNDIGLPLFAQIPFTEFVSPIIDETDMPMRTSVLVNTASKMSKLLFSNLNILINPYWKNEEIKQGSNNILFDIKWSGGSEKQYISIYFEELLRLIRNKVILNGGNINDTKVYWSAPLSMQRRDMDRLSDLWFDNFQQIFKKQEGILCLSEAYAPYRYLQSSKLVPNEDLCNIDIGGGTTDILFAESGNPAYNTSFRFAGDAIWGEGFNEGSRKDNPFLEAFKEYLGQQNREEDSFKTAKAIFDEYFEDPEMKSNDVISLCFKYNDVLEFSRFLEDAKNLRAQFLIHYTAIIYHLAEIIKNKNMKVPRYFIFTGMGSKYIKLLDPKMGIITEVTKEILSRVTEKSVPSNFELINVNESKQATAKGSALYEFNPSLPVGVLYNGERYFNPTNETINLIGQTENEKNETFELYKDITPTLQNSVADNVVKFIHLIFKTPNITKHFSNLGIQTEIDDYVASWESRKGDGIKKGLNLVNPNGANKDAHIAETLFFYDIKEKLYQVGKEIFAKHKK